MDKTGIHNAQIVVPTAKRADRAGNVATFKRDALAHARAVLGSDVLIPDSVLTAIASADPVGFFAALETYR